MLPSHILIILILCIVKHECAKNVTISKCCTLDEQLTGRIGCETILDGVRRWNFKVFSPAKRNYLPPDQVPTNWHLKPATQPDCPRPALITAHLGNYVPFQNGSLFVVEYNRLIHPSNYCIDYNAALVCIDDGTADNRVKVKKCCGQNAVFSETNGTCIRINTTKSYQINLPDNITLTNGYPNCGTTRITLIGELDTNANLLVNGSLELKASKQLISSDSYCLEHLLGGANALNIVACSEDVPEVVVTTDTSRHDLRFTIYPICLALSAVFLAATLAAGSLLPASHHVLHWRCQTNHVACLLVGDVLLCITQLSGRMDLVPCFMIAVAMHFLFLAAFFWLNTMCFNIWWTFRDLRPQSVEKGQERCRLRLYEIYAWGGPLLIASIAAILDVVPGNTSDFLRPKFGKNTCWFYGNNELLTYFFGPVGILLVFNLILFALTARELTCGLWKRELVKSTTERAALSRVCMKLVVVMGVTWIADVLSWLVGGPQELWYVTDLINCLQGVFIFIVVGCQPQVLAAAKRLWCWRRRRGNGGNIGTTNHHSSSSQGMPSMGDTVTNNSVNTKSVPLETSC